MKIVVKFAKRHLDGRETYRDVTIEADNFSMAGHIAADDPDYRKEKERVIRISEAGYH